MRSIVFSCLLTASFSGCAYSTGNLIGDLTTSREQRMYYRMGDPRYRGANWQQVNRNLLAASASMNAQAAARSSAPVVVMPPPVQGQAVRLAPGPRATELNYYDVTGPDGVTRRYRVTPR